MRLIDAEALKEVFEENIANCKMQLRHADLFEEDLIYLEAEKETYECVVAEIDDTRTIGAEPVRHGRWNFTSCSLCEKSFLDYAEADCDKGMYLELPNYCPNCGARMVQNENEVCGKNHTNA